MWFMGWAGCEDAAGDGARLLPHLGRVGEGANLPQVLRGVVEDAGEPGGWRGLAHQRALNLGGSVDGVGRLTWAQVSAGGGGGYHFLGSFCLRTESATCAA